MPLTLGPDEALFRELSGVATEVRATAAGPGFREAALFTHRGLSGPAILQASSYWRSGAEVRIDFLPDRRPTGCSRRSGNSRARRCASCSPCPTGWPRRWRSGWASTGWRTRPTRRCARAGERLGAWPFRPNGTEGYAKAEVTVGGISTAELSSKTMESRRVPGLYAIGEAVDVTGWLGGYNFQWAWASGSATGHAL